MVDHRVDPSDEGRHPSEPQQFWQESWYADFVSDDETVAGYIRLGYYPNLGASWWTAMVVTPDGPLTAAANYELAVPPQGIGFDEAGWSAQLEAEEPLGVWTVRSQSPAVSHHDPAAPYLGAPGEPTRLALDLTWLTMGMPYHYELTTRYEVPCDVTGEVTIGDTRFEVNGQGQRDHSWGERDWWSMAWCWSAARLGGGTRVHAVDVRLPGMPVAFGYIQEPLKGLVEPVVSLQVTEELGPHGLPTGARIGIEPGGLVLDVQPLAFAPLLLTAPDGRTSRFPRAWARFTAADGRSGPGWIEWNQPQPG